MERSASKHGESYTGTSTTVTPAAELASLGMDNFAFLSKASHADDWNDRQEATEQTQHGPTAHLFSLFLRGSGRIVLPVVSYRKLMQMPIGRRIG